MRPCSSRRAARSGLTRRRLRPTSSRPRSPASWSSPTAWRSWRNAPARPARPTPPTGSPSWCCGLRVLLVEHDLSRKPVPTPDHVGTRLFRDHAQRGGEPDMKLPRDIGPIHFVGIGGIGMSGIAEVLANLGYTVTGSDVAESANVKRLRDKGIAVAIGHAAANVDGADVLVVSSAIKRDNPELVAARAKRLPVVRRAEMLAELMRLKSCIAIAGTHGKTTTTSLVATLLDAGHFDPTVINGGIINAYGTNARLGAGDWMVVEADESDGTFLKLPADIAIVTNVDPEHLDHFKTFAAVQEAFLAFVENLPFYGFSVMCTDHPVVQNLVGHIEDHRIVTYGENPQADVRLVELSHAGGTSLFTIVLRERAGHAAHEIKNIALPMPGRHNALNSTAAVAVA